MFTNESESQQPQLPFVTNEIFQNITANTGTPIVPGLWVLDGAATTNLSNGIGFIPGTKKNHVTIIEVVGKSQLKCDEIADFLIKA